MADFMNENKCNQSNDRQPDTHATIFTNTLRSIGNTATVVESLYVVNEHDKWFYSNQYQVLSFPIKRSRQYLGDYIWLRPTLKQIIKDDKNQNLHVYTNRKSCMWLF